MYVSLSSLLTLLHFRQFQLLLPDRSQEVRFTRKQLSSVLTSSDAYLPKKEDEFGDEIWWTRVGKHAGDAGEFSSPRRKRFGSCRENCRAFVSILSDVRLPPENELDVDRSLWTCAGEHAEEDPLVSGVVRKATAGLLMAL